jgi:PAS domain S-box-containing protein
MRKPALPENDSRRVETLHDLQILDTGPEERFDRLARIAKSHYGVPIALVGLVDANRQWFKSCLGLDVTETDRRISFCGHAILEDKVLYVENALDDARFDDNPLVTGSPYIRFYAGAPLYAPDGMAVGSLCIVDTEPRRFSDSDFDVLRDLARCVESELAGMSHRERAERKAAAKAQVLEATFENMNQGIAVFDARHTLVEFNQRYREIRGYPKDFLHLGMNRRDLLRYKADYGLYGDGDVEAAMEARLSTADVPASGERQLRDGRYYSFMRSPLPDGGYIIAVTDITEHRNSEKQLQQAQKMEAVGQLTGGIAHDFNNLLAVAQGNVELAQEAAEKGGDVRRYLSAIKRVSERGASLTNQLLAFSRKQTLYPESTDVGHLVTEMGDLLSRSMGETIEVEVTRGTDLWPCEVDRNQLESAILNLAVNARDAMPNGGTLSIRTVNMTVQAGEDALPSDMEPGDYVLVSVADTGTGISKDLLDHVFEPFFTTKDVGHGTGLGLSMVYGFVKQSQGQVTINSVEGEGTTFNLYLPRCVQAQGRAERDNVERATAPGGETILVVEDDPEVRHLSAEMLRNQGYRIVEAADGNEALNALATASRVDLLFTDVVLPGGLSGLDLAAEVRSKRPELPVLYTSGYINVASVDEEIFDQDMELLRKPFSKQDLATKVRRVLDRDRQADQPLRSQL